MLLLLLSLFLPGLAANCNAPWSEQDRQGILGVHNNLRSKIARGTYRAGDTVKGPASDMLQMEYDCGLEESAQRVAELCPAKEVRSTENVHWRYSNTWQNIGGQGVQAAQKWEREFQDHGWSSTGTQAGIERAIKMAWSRTSKVGCGVKQCQQGQLVVVCHYSPEGNISGQDVYTPGQMCSACPSGTTCNRSKGLCTTGQGQGDVDRNDEDWLGNDWNNIFETFQHRFDNAFGFQDTIDSILKRWGPLESKWKVWKVPTFRKFWKINHNVFDKWISCRKGQSTGTEWTDGAFRFRCEGDGTTRFMGCIASDGSVVADGTVKNVGGIETTCKKHPNGTMVREIVSKHGGSYHDIQQLTRNDDNWAADKGLIKERQGKRIIITTRRGPDQSIYENRTAASLDFELSSQCAEPLHKGNTGTCNQRPGIMWYMDRETLTCLAFKYTGCGGNRNRFTTKDECQRTCLPSDFQSCPANSPPVRRADQTSHCNTKQADHLDCPRGAVCKMGYAVGLCCDAEISRRVDANYEPSCSRGKKIYKSWQFGTTLIHLGKTCSHDFCPSNTSCHQGEYFAYCCK